MVDSTRRVTGVGLAATILATVYAVTESDWLKASLAIAGALGPLLWGFWPDIFAARRERRKRSADAADLGFERVENLPFIEGASLGWRVRLRPKGYIFEGLLRFEYDAALVSYRWRVEGRPGGRYSDLHMPLGKAKIAERSARAIEIGFTGPPTLTSDTDLVFELISAEPIRVTRVARLR